MFTKNLNIALQLWNIGLVSATSYLTSESPELLLEILAHFLYITQVRPVIVFVRFKKKNLFFPILKPPNRTHRLQLSTSKSTNEPIEISWVDIRDLGIRFEPVSKMSKKFEHQFGRFPCKESLIYWGPTCSNPSLSSGSLRGEAWCTLGCDFAVAVWLDARTTVWGTRLGPTVESTVLTEFWIDPAIRAPTSSSGSSSSRFAAFACIFSS